MSDNELHEYPYTNYHYVDGLQRKYPYTVEHEIDLDFFLKKIEELEKEYEGVALVLTYDVNTNTLILSDDEGHILTSVEIPVISGPTGPQGPAGADGITPDITATAMVGSSTGNPTVSVTKSGTTANPVLNFAFNGLKAVDGKNGKDGLNGVDGLNGITPNISATASVDNYTGTPNVIVTKSGTDANPVLNFAFMNLKGMQGERGLTGPQGEKGDQGNGIQIAGFYDTYADFIAEHPTGTTSSDIYIVGENGGGGGGNANTDIIAPEFDDEGTVIPGPTYSAGDYVEYNSNYYLCLSETSGDWDSSKWELLTITPLDQWGSNIPSHGYCLYNDLLWYNPQSVPQWFNPSAQDHQPFISYTYTAYDPGSSSYHQYSVGDYCIYNGKLYRCTNATTGQSWDSTAWTETTVMDEITALQ